MGAKLVKASAEAPQPRSPPPSRRDGGPSASASGGDADGRRLRRRRAAAGDDELYSMADADAVPKQNFTWHYMKMMRLLSGKTHVRALTDAALRERGVGTRRRRDRAAAPDSAFDAFEREHEENAEVSGTCASAPLSLSRARCSMRARCSTNES